MAHDYIFSRVIAWMTFVTNAVVCAVAVRYYLGRARRSVLLIAVSGGLGAIVSAVSWISGTSSPAFWYLIDFAGVLDLCLWTVGIYLLLKELTAYDSQALPPNLTLATSIDDSGASKQPPKEG